jgi:predicted transcriptional regulator
MVDSLAKDNDVSVIKEGVRFNEGKLEIDGAKWTIEPKSVDQSSGIERAYDASVVSTDGNERLIVFRADDDDITNKIAMANVVGNLIKASMSCVLLNRKPTDRERVMAESLNVKIIENVSLINEGRKYDIISVNAYKKIENNAFPQSLRRHRAQIMGDVLKYLRNSEGAGITSIVYKCNLNYKAANRIITEMIKKNLLFVELSGKKKIFRITRNGEDFLDRISGLDF